MFALQVPTMNLMDAVGHGAGALEISKRVLRKTLVVSNFTENLYRRSIFWHYLVDNLLSTHMRQDFELLCIIFNEKTECNDQQTTTDYC